MRRNRTALQRTRIFDAQGGICHICERKIAVGEKWQLDHIKPLWLGGEDTDWNTAPAHVDCHAGKTGDEHTVRAKGDRVRARHLGIKKPKKWKWPSRKIGARR
jgi:5-methylcytosine-specific restriction protein A